MAIGQQNRETFWQLNKSSVPVTIATQHNSASAANTITSVPAGALLVLCTGVNTNSNVDCSVSSSPSLTWTKRSDAGGTNTDGAEIWTAVSVAGGTVAITADWSQNEQYSTVYAVTGYDASLGGASGSQITGSTSSVSVTTTRANSILFAVTADWNAADGSSRSIRSTSTEDQYYHPSGAITGYNYHKQTTTVSSYTMGYSAPTGQVAATAVYEIRGN